MRRSSWTKATDGACLHHILIDHENVQPADLAGLDAHDACVWVFTGAQQKVAISLIEAVQALGERGRFVRISGNGRNALDFHIAYYLGGFAARDPSASFLIVSADAGYDPLIKHLNAQGIVARRIPLPQVAAHPKAAPSPRMVTAPAATAQPSPKPNGGGAAKKSKTLSFIVDPPPSKALPATGNEAAPSPGPAQSGVNGKKPTQASQSDADTVIRRLQDMPQNLPRSEASLRRMVGTWLSKDGKRLDAVLAVLRQRSIIVTNGTRLGYQLPKA